MHALGRRQHGGIGESREVAAVQCRSDMLGQLGESQLTIRLLHADDLVPGGGHQVFLVVLDNAGAEAADHPVARVEVELPEPLRLGRGRTGLGLHPRLAGMRRPVERWTDKRRAGVLDVRLLVGPVEGGGEFVGDRLVPHLLRGRRPLLLG